MKYLVLTLIAMMSFSFPLYAKEAHKQVNTQTTVSLNNSAIAYNSMYPVDDGVLHVATTMQNKKMDSLATAELSNPNNSEVAYNSTYPVEEGMSNQSISMINKKAEAKLGNNEIDNY